MITREEYFAPIAGRFDLPLLERSLVVVVGIGTVGSHIAELLAQNAVGRLLLIDGDTLEPHNLLRHVLTHEYLGQNKAVALARYLGIHIPGLEIGAFPNYLDSAVPAAAIDGLLNEADLIIAATDRRDAQRHIAQRALVLDIAALFPGLHEEGGSEIFLQRSWRFPCYMCWDGWRPADAQLRDFAGTEADTLSLIQLAVPLSLAILDHTCEHAELLRPPDSASPPPQLYVQNRYALGFPPVPRRRRCPVCGGRSDEARPVSSARPQQTAALTFDWFATRVAYLIGALLVLALPYGIMESSVIGKHPVTVWMNFVSIFCFFVFLAGICAVLAAIASFFSR